MLYFVYTKLHWLRRDTDTKTAGQSKLQLKQQQHVQIQKNFSSYLARYIWMLSQIYVIWWTDNKIIIIWLQSCPFFYEIDFLSNKNPGKLYNSPVLLQRFMGNVFFKAHIDPKLLHLELYLDRKNTKCILTVTKTKTYIHTYLFIAINVVFMISFSE